MSVDYLTTALQFTSRNEKNELNEERAESQASEGLNSFSSLPTPGALHDAKVSILASVSGSAANAWQNAILAGIRYAKEGRVNPAAIHEDIDVWRELASWHGWTPAPAGLVSNELNELNEGRRLA
jgi:hypothetical protein